MNFRLMAAAAVSVLALAGTANADEVSTTASTLRALGAQVRLRIGTAANPTTLGDAALSQIVADQFSVLTPENDMKWQVVEPTQGNFNWTGADNLVSFAEQHGQLVRGHTLMWHNQLPTWLTQGVANGTISASQLRDLLHQHINIEVGRYRGKIWQWDVVNELLADANPSQIRPNDFWVSNLGPGIVADAFRWAHAADPEALLCYNDYNIAGEDGSNAKHNAAVALIKSLQAQKAPIDCVGDQGHLDLQFGFNQILMTQDLQEFASLGLKVAITEADVRTFVETTDTNQSPVVSPTDQTPNHTADPAAADWYVGMVQSCLTVKACISFTVWGFADSHSWVPGTFNGEGDADLYDVNLNPKPQFTGVQQTLSLARGAPKRARLHDRDHDGDDDDHDHDHDHD
jgi:endo-1,4-beta-xylanase